MKRASLGSFILLNITLLIFSINLLAQEASPTDLMLQGNRFYEAGDYAQAAQSYQSLIEQGYRNSEVFYNLGNAHFKGGDIGRAILNYRRAARLTPRDPDIRANLKVARAQTLDKLEADSQSPAYELVSFTQNRLTLDEMAWLALILWLLTVLLLIALTRLAPGRARGIARYSLMAIALLLLINSIALGSRLYVEKIRPAGVIVAAQVDVTSGPGEQYITEFTLRSGAEVNLLDERESWIRLALSGDALQGWVPTDAVEAVQPAR